MIFGFGDTAYFIENGVRVTPVMVLDRMEDVYTIRINNRYLHVRHTRLYTTKEEAEKNIVRLEGPKEPIP